MTTRDHPSHVSVSRRTPSSQAGTVNPMGERQGHEVPDTEAIRKIGDFVALAQLLNGCIISPNYAVTTEMADAIHLSQLGWDFVTKLREAHRRTRPNEAKLAVALHVGIGDDLLIEPSEIDIERLRTAISHDVANKKVLYPNPYLRDTSERLMKDHEFDPLVTNSEILQILRDQEQGVFQIGDSVVGPWGCISSQSHRDMEPDRRIYGFMCENVGCNTVHPFHLKTADNAPINRARRDLHPILEARRVDAIPRILRFSKLEWAKSSQPSPLIDSASLLNFIGDALAEREREGVVGILLREMLRELPFMRSKIAGLSHRILNDPDEFARQLQFGEQMQLLHMGSDETLVRSVDLAVQRGLIKTNPNTRRRARFERWRNPNLALEVGPQGLRFRVPDDRVNVVLGHVLQGAYAEDTVDLAFALDQPEGESLDSLISFAFQTLDANAVVDTCILNDRRTATKACQLFYINDTGLSKGDRADLLRWRLGISSEASISRTETITEAIEAYLRMDPNTTVEAKRGHLSNIYVDLETELMLALKFCSWALTEDHYDHSQPFTLRPEELPSVEKHVCNRSGEIVADKPTLHPIAGGFARLADELALLPRKERDLDNLPRWIHLAKRPFAFPHLATFHDLTDESQGSVLDLLKTATRDFTHGDVISVRNDGPGHGNNAFPSDDKIRSALTLIRQGLSSLASAGLTPLMYTRRETSRGNRGQSLATYRSWVGEAVVKVPFWPLAPGLPGLSERLILVPAASGPGWGHLRFVVPLDDSGGEKWNGWPPRRRTDRTGEWETGSAITSEPGSLTA